MITVLQERVLQDVRGAVGEICTACDQLSTCRFRTTRGMPVFFCEEFAYATAAPQVERDEVYALPGGYEDEFAVRKPENARFSYTGLCSSCLRLSTCMHLKPGGGTWDCAAYEELRA
jgi:hypothetical protein